MSALRTKVGVSAAGLFCLMAVGYSQAQQVTEEIKPAQYADQNTGRPLSADQQGRQLNENPATTGQRNTTYFRGPDASGSNDRNSNTSASVDQYLANCLAIHNQAEIDINQFAQSRAQSDDVKKFTEQMIKDHNQLAQKLERLTQDRAENRDSTLNRLTAIDRQITEKCGQMTQSKLEDAAKDQFDQCFIGAQVGAHMQMLAALEVISQQATGDLRQVAQDAKSTVKEHLDHAEQLMKDLDSNSDRDNRQARNDR